MGNTELQFYETPAFAIGVTLVCLAASIVLTVLGVRMKNLSWLFPAAWLCMVPAFLVFYRKIQRTPVKVCLNFGSWVLLAGLLFWFDRSYPSQEEKPKITPVISWFPASIGAGESLTATQLNATATVNGIEIDGTPVYNPTFGATLSPGTTTLSVTFTFSDPSYSSVTKTTPLQVAQLPGPASATTTLRKRANDLAREILDYADERDRLWNEQDARIITDPTMSVPQKLAADESAKISFVTEKQNRFISLYGPQVQKMMDELSAANVDVSPVTRAAAGKGPEYVAIRLSAIGERVGKRPPFARVLTPVEAAAVVRGLHPGDVEVYADESDHNSASLAEALRSEFEHQHWKVNRKVHPIERDAPKLKGIHVIYPSSDWAVSENLGYALNACDIATSIDVRHASQPPPVIKIEVWPDTTPP